MCQALLVVLVLDVGLSHVTAHLGVIRIQTEGFGEVGDSPHVVLLFDEGITPEGVEFGVFRVEPDSLVEVGDGPSILLFGVGGGAAVAVGVGIFCVEADDLSSYSVPQSLASGTFQEARFVEVCRPRQSKQYR
jgi:hypothetical protein